MDRLEQGVSRSARALVAALPDKPQGPFLDLGSTDGLVAQWAVERLEAAAYAHVDLLDCQAAGATAGLTTFHADVPPPGPWATVALDGRAFEPGLARELALGVAARLAADGVCYATAPQQVSAAAWAATLAQAFGQVEMVGEEPPVAVARLPRPAAPPQEDAWTVEFGGQTLRFASGPGLFSPGGLDAGTRTMLEAVPTPAAGERWLDLGCGVGTVSVIAAACWGCHVTAVDVNARALRQTAANAAANGVGERVRVLASDGFSALRGEEFDGIISHPPYHTDYAVAKAFIEGARRHLKVGGSLWLVVKRGDWYANKLRTVFGGCRALERAGYVVLSAQKREKSAATGPAAPPVTTKKHEKRMAATAGRKKGRRP